MKVGAANVAKVAHKMGITTPLDPYPSIGIGGLTIGVSPLEMASAYGTLANGGVHVEPNAITRIEDFDGNVIKEVVPEGKLVVKQNVAYQATEILQGVIQRGTATRANIGRPAAGKTGTNQLYRDAWFVGYTPSLVTAVWMGYPEAQISMYNVHGSRGFGGIIPATIWRKYMSSTLKGTPVLNFPKATWSNKQKGTSYTSSSTSSSWSDSARSYIKKRWNKWKKGNKKRGALEQAPQPPPPPPSANSAPSTNYTPPANNASPPVSPPSTSNQNQQNRTDQGNGNDGSNNPGTSTQSLVQE
jgi:penicillin-binding protein 1A